MGASGAACHAVTSPQSRDQYETARQQIRWDPIYPNRQGLTYAVDRSVAPRRHKRSCGGGPVQSRLYADPELHEFLCDETGLRLKPSGDRGSYAYYVLGGDFIGLLRDTDYCDAVLLTVLRDEREEDEEAGAVVLYPERFRESCEEIAASPCLDAEVVKLRVGQSLLLLGGAIPHKVAPVSLGQNRIVSALCFSVVG